jgi:hypothetical protein
MLCIGAQAHTLTPLLGAACQHPSRSWRWNFVRLELWEILYTLSRLMPLQDKALNVEHRSLLDSPSHDASTLTTVYCRLSR